MLYFSIYYVVYYNSAGIGTLTRHGGHGMHHSGAHQAVPVSIPVPPELPTAPPPPLSAGHPPGMSAGHTANLMLHQIPPPSSNNTGQQGIIGLPATEISAMQAAQVKIQGTTNSYC